MRDLLISPVVNDANPLVEQSRQARSSELPLMCRQFQESGYCANSSRIPSGP